MTNAKFEDIPIAENNDLMVNLKDYPFVLAPMYFDWDLSESPDLWTRKAIADRLFIIQKEQLKPLGRQFKIWDPWRSRIVQNNIYQKFWDEKKLAFEVGVFVTHAKNPNRIPPHASGGSIDLTIVEDGEEIDFGTKFDDFTPKAAIDYFDHNEENNEARDNRKWLHKIMYEAGFCGMSDEWWHFDYGNQLWALELNKPQAFYGEVVDPISFNQKPRQDIRHALT